MAFLSWKAPPELSIRLCRTACEAPGWDVAVVIIKRRAAIGEERGGHKGSVAPDGFCVQRRILIGAIGWGYHWSDFCSGASCPKLTSGPIFGATLDRVWLTLGANTLF
jgi:hypothetical protein